MEVMNDNSIELMDSDFNVSYDNSSVFWGGFIAATSYPLFTITGGSVGGITNISNVSVGGSNRVSVFESDLIIPLYVVIFVLSIVGNSLVLVTLAQNKRMRTVTNVYLLNLAVADLLLGVFCMPFTLVGQVLRNFVFGAAMCKLISFFQAVSVSVGVWTLVAISLERYFAICRPLKSRRWQTQFHAYKMIVMVWLASLIWNSPILVVSRLQAIKVTGRHKCREEWPSKSSERAYNIFLDAMLLLVPLIIMSLAYSLIVSKLWKGLRREIRHNSSCRRQLERTSSSATVNEVVMTGNINGGSTTGNAVITPLRHHRLFSANPSQQPILPRQATAATAVCSGTDGNHRTATSVKLWLFKGMVQARLPSSNDVASGRYRDRPGSLSTGKTVAIPSQQTTTSAGPYNAPPETSRLIGSSARNGTTCREEKDPRGHGSAVDGDDVIAPPGESPNTYTFTRHAIRSNYMDKSIEAKKKVIRMLFVVVAEFFVCWAPLHVLNTWYTFNPDAVYRTVGSTGVSLVQLLAYISSCCNPITYCFMNRKFRQAFLGVFDCYRCWSLYCCCCCASDVGPLRSSRLGGLQRDGAVLGGLGGNNSDVSGNDSTVFVGRASVGVRSEVVELEAEDRV
ncbi:gastrin/cholecystokinin type B receptor-like isoform X3 [Zootermopsis nevadensis]|uniref:gastrin/cholecystokinin type B receptor-like isoform X3 n=1 Tax=Zootermopsis nevadensis TaxID=136037 RepID=UPI000B8ED79C|nr:gastrin/cholecystokinin type B receptor-like isoform X3 [Zootermopsis nevadensis]